MTVGFINGALFVTDAPLSRTNLGLGTLAVLNSPLPAVNGGTAQTTYAAGDTLYASAINTLAKLTIGSTGQVLTVAAGVPSWATPTTGTVTSVSGTTNRITSTGGATPVIDISAAYVGQTSLTTLGTVTTGVWNATAIGPTFGGTGITTYATGDILYASATNTLSKLAAAADGRVLTLASGIPSWAVPSAGSVTSVSGTTNQVAVANGTTTPVISLVGPYTPSTYTAHGILVGEGTSSIAAMATGSAGQIVQSGGASADPVYSTATYPATTTVNRLLYSSATNTIADLATANSGVVVTTSAGVPLVDNVNFIVSQTTGVNVKGSTAVIPTGYIGELVSGNRLVGSAISVTNNTATNITSITLTAGTWEITGIGVISGITTGVYVNLTASTTSATQGTLGDNMVQISNTSNSNNNQSLTLAGIPVSSGSSTTYFLTIFANYSVGAATAWGYIRARRVG